MCRINGIMLYNNKSDHSVIEIGRKMRDKLTHGGPDDYGEYYDLENSLFLGHRRLSIIDTSSGGHQPMKYKNYIIVFNGEIYNYKLIAEELKSYGYKFDTKSDTEVLLKSWDMWGKECLSKIHGMFSFALWDYEKKQIILCRDRYGVKPLYWYLKDDILLFASELKAFYQYPKFDKEINKLALIKYLQFGYISSPLTIYKNVHKVNPGTLIVFNNNQLEQEEKYYELPIDYSYNEFSKNDFKKEETEERLTKSFNLRMVADVQVGIFLSSGIDSTLLLALLRNSSNQNLKTFTIGFENKSYDESVNARKIANHFETEHYELICSDDTMTKQLDRIISVFDEPFGDSSAIPTYLVSWFANQHVKVALSADGADEIFGGYDRYKALKYFKNTLGIVPYSLRNSKLLNSILQNLSKSISKNLVKNSLRNFEARLAKFVNSVSAKEMIDYFQILSMIESQKTIYDLVGSNYYMSKDYSINDEKDDRFFSRLTWIDFKEYLEGDILTKIDRTTMACSLEGREPFLDQDVVEWGLELKDFLKVKNGENKWILREILKKYLPNNLIQKKKLGFGIPIHRLLVNNYKEELINMVYDSDFTSTFSINSIVLKELINNYLSDKNIINPHFIWTIFMLYKWHNKWNK